MKTRLALVALAGFFAFGPSHAPQAQAQITQSSGAYLMRMKFVPGQVMKYTMTTSSSMSGNAGAKPFQITMPITMKVVSVTKGVATVQTTVDMRSVSKESKPQTVTVQMDNMGNIVGGDQGGAGAMMGSATFPKNAIKVGQSWTAKINQTGMKMDATYKLLGVKTVGGVSLANVGITLKGNGQGMNTAGTGSMMLRTADGSLHSTDISMSMKQGTNNMTIKVKMVRN